MRNDRLIAEEINKLEREKRELLDRYADLQYRYDQVEHNVLIKWLRKRLNF